jgi:hypothetical protein
VNDACAGRKKMKDEFKAFENPALTCYEESIIRSIWSAGREPSKIIVSRGLMDALTSGMALVEMTESEKRDFKAKNPENTAIIFGRRVLIVKDTGICCIAIDG